MNLVMVDIKDNQKAKHYPKNALEYIDRAATAMFVAYNDEFDGSIYLIKEEVFQAMIPSLDTHEIDFVVISKHSITTKLDKKR